MDKHQETVQNVASLTIYAHLHHSSVRPTNNISRNSSCRSSNRNSSCRSSSRNSSCRSSSINSSCRYRSRNSSCRSSSRNSSIDIRCFLYIFTQCPCNESDQIRFNRSHRDICKPVFNSLKRTNIKINIIQTTQLRKFQIAQF